MVFSANPLALSVPEPAFESWLRDGGYLEILDQRTSDLHCHAPTSASTTSATTSAAATATEAVFNGFFAPAFSYIWTLLSLITLNPFAKLTAEDFSCETPSWTVGFIGFFDSYSIPSSPSQARLRVHENVKRYARNYASLFILFFACALYQMPLALVGLLSGLALWDAFRLCSDRWGLHQYPAVRQSLIRIIQCATIIILFFSNVQVALFCALGVSYAVMLSHAAFRKLTPTKQPTCGRSK
ncbi:PRA1 family protein H isoform X2 [Malania oleifera]|uniref:PRA1 family protein H isoform X2 n=1 Tax=Malania oleifera TaxID=397392 RepID=UPI0025AEB398|nr:PRA1 family protein H isoform X2 [Malania oleifera]